MLTDEQKQAVANLAAYHNGQFPREYLDYIVATHEPMDNLKAIAEVVVHQFANFGRGYILFGVQREKGDTRTTIYVIDFGDIRGLFEI